MREERLFGGLANDSLQFSGERWRQAFLHKLSTEPVAVLQYMILVSKAYTPPPRTINNKKTITSLPQQPTLLALTVPPSI